MYFPPAQHLKKALKFEADGENVVMPMNIMAMLLRAAFGNVFDARWYRATYPDIAEALAQGTISSEFQHFVETGYWEGRAPCSFDVSEDWYRFTYVDVDRAIEEGQIASGHTHYNKNGYLEGRAPDAAGEVVLSMWARALPQDA